VKKPDKPETDYQHMIMVGIAIFAVATLAWTFVIFVIRLFEKARHLPALHPSTGRD
jgi:hypothetical protein